MLRPYEGVIAVETGHINVHECGAIEATGHKVETIKPVNGQLTAADLEAFVKARDDEHMVQLGAVYISQATELGTVYTRDELCAISKVCHDNGLYLYVDGARLGVALVSDACEGLKMSDLVELCDCFYIGATKNGGMLGEAMVIINNDLKYGFRNLMKQNGAMMAKGVLLGIQFDTLFTDDLFFLQAAKENRLARKIRKSLEEMGFRFLVPSPTNQQFPIFPNELIDKLHEEFEFLVWEKGEKESPVRLVTSWATAEEDVALLIKRVRELHV
jgi:threonine aldolase